VKISCSTRFYGGTQGYQEVSIANILFGNIGFPVPVDLLLTLDCRHVVCLVASQPKHIQLCTDNSGQPCRGLDVTEPGQISLEGMH